MHIVSAEKGERKLKTIKRMVLMALLTCMLTLVFASGASGDGGYWIDSPSDFPPCPPIPPETYAIVYDTESETRIGWGFDSISLIPEPFFRVRFTPQKELQLVREVRIGWYGNDTNDNTFEIHIVDADSGYTMVTGVIYENNNLDFEWKVYDVSWLAFYTHGDFYIELWAPFNSEMFVAGDTDEPFNERSECWNGTGWEPLPTDFPAMPCDLRIRAIVEIEVTQLVGGIWIHVDKLALLAPYIFSTSLILVAAAATAIYVKRKKKRQ